MGRWDYRIEWLDHNDGVVSVQEYLKKLGKDGWELTTIVRNCGLSYEAIFKRSYIVDAAGYKEYVG